MNYSNFVNTKESYIDYTNPDEGYINYVSDELPTNIIQFKDLWKNYPTEKIIHINPSTKEDTFDSHCAINVSEALFKSGIGLKSFKGQRCWNKCPSGKNVHAIRAQELANWLKTVPFKGCPNPKQYSGKNYEVNVEDKKGIIFFQDYWQRPNESGETRTGDHIDLWNKNELASIGLFLTWIRSIFPDWFGMSDLNKSKTVLFWEIM
ncbi:MAG: hypothetical protein ISS16_06895 [Ignavibacteria bacterium]|nr:hypothetical protein [Ignavibacteria bacterium]